MKTFKLSLLVALFAFAGNVVATDKTAKPEDKPKTEADSKADKDGGKKADDKAGKDAKKAITGADLAKLETDATGAAKGTDEAKAYADAKKEAGFFTKVNAFGRNHKMCVAKGAGALLVAGAVGYYVGTRVEKAEVEEQLAA